jgi:hypothetical protein
MVPDQVRMGSIGTVAFDATAAAAEMEVDREDARRNRFLPVEVAPLP